MKQSRYSEEQVVRILGEVQAGKTVREVCKAHGVSEFTFYTWRKKYAGGAGAGRGADARAGA